MGAWLALLTGCGGTSTPDRTAGLTSDEILRQSRAASATLSAFHLTGKATVTATITPGASLPKLVVQALRAPVTIAGEGTVNGDAVTVDLDATISGLPPLQGNVTKVADRLFVSVLGTDYKVDLPPRQVAAVVPGRLVGGLLAWADAPSDAGREKVDGVATVHLRTTIEPARALADILPAVQAVRPGAVTPTARRQMATALTTRTMDLWIGVDDLRPRRIAADIVFSGPVAAVPGLRRGSLKLDLLLTKLGEVVEITAPTTTNILDLNRLSSLAGG